MSDINVAAVDLGASSGRVVLGHVGADRLAIEAVSRFPNDPVTQSDGLHWDVRALYRHALDGIASAAQRVSGDLAGVAVDSWAVDYALVRDGEVLGEPFHYRDERRGEVGPARVHERISQQDLYGRNGLQHLPFNTVYQLAADQALADGDRMLLVPDLLAWWLSGEQVTERTNASTTGLLDVHTGRWDTALLDLLGLPTSLVGALVDPGGRIGSVLPGVAEHVGVPDLAVTAVGSHDTASAVVGVPIQTDDAAYISCGTWGLVGLELDAPVLSEDSRAANFTNEGGVDGRIRFLTNVMGLWLLSETLRQWERDGDPDDLEQLLAGAAEVVDAPVFDVQDARFMPPGDMPARIGAWFAEREVAAPTSRPALVRSIVESLAEAFANAVETAQGLAGRTVRTVHVVGGGALNLLLCQAVADRSGRVVLAGPVEATAIGNVLVQARTHGAVTGDLESLRRLVVKTHEPRRFSPRSDRARLGT